MPGERRHEHGAADAVERDEHERVPELERPGDREDAQRRDCRAANRVRQHEHEPPLEAVAHDAAEQDQQHLWRRPGDADERERRRRVRDRVHLPGDRDRVQAVAEEGHGHAGPEQGEVANPERTEDADSVERKWADGHLASPRSLAVCCRKFYNGLAGDEDILEELACPPAGPAVHVPAEPLLEPQPGRSRISG